MNVKRRTAETLNSLYKLLTEREEFYKSSAMNVLDIDLIPLLNQYEFQSKQFRSELLLFFIPEEKEETLQEQLKDKFKDFVKTFSRLKGKVLVNKVFEFEKNLVASYKEIVSKGLPDPKVQKLLESQYKYIKSNLEKLKMLKESVV